MSSKFSARLTECKKPGLTAKGLAFFLLLSLYLTALWWYEGAQTNSSGARTLIAQLIRYFGDAAIITFPFALLKPRFRWTVLIPVWIISIWVIGAIWYFRFWGDIPGVAIVFLVSNVGHELFYSLLALWRPIDFIFILCPLALTILYKAYKPLHSFRFSPRVKLFTMLFASVSFMAGQGVNTHLVKVFNDSINNTKNVAQITLLRLKAPVFTNRNDIAINGPIIHFFKSTGSAFKVLNLRKDLTERDRKTIENFITSSAEFPALADSIIEKNQSKNIILILVESLNAKAIHKMVGGKPVAPTLCSLIDAEGSISALNIVSQVDAGGSGDGQLITNTGLHPLSYFSVPIALGSTNSFPGLPRVLGREDNVVVFADNCQAWNERPTFTSYGFPHIYCNTDYPELVTRFGGDGAMLNFASTIIPNLREPFFLELLTVSMHAPFDDANIPAERLPRLSCKGYENDPASLKYLRMLNYFDSELGLFIDRLKKAKLYDNTLLIIASDHSQELINFGEPKSPMALIITNCGITNKIDRTVGQVDIYPTILNLTGTIGPKNYRGMGSSMLDPDLNAALTPSGYIEGDESADEKRLINAQKISEIIHRTNYFGH